jgi:hypothetical protein
LGLGYDYKHLEATYPYLSYGVLYIPVAEAAPSSATIHSPLELLPLLWQCCAFVSTLDGVVITSTSISPYHLLLP